MVLKNNNKNGIQTFPELLRGSLARPLPGQNAHLQMIPAHREFPEPDSFTESSVLVLFHHDPETGWQFPLILRSEVGFAHGGQVGLPGGRLEQDESLVECALRETHEEIGTDPKNIQMLGQLTPLPIPVSRYVVYPFVAYTDDVPRYIPDPAEVQAVIDLPARTLLESSIIAHGDVIARGQKLTVPYFMHAGHRIWGATAMILSELRAVLIDIVRNHDVL